MSDKLEEKGKNPADAFYWQDFYRDMHEHPLEISGAWILILCKLWYSETRGKMTRTLEQWSRILGAQPEKTQTLLRYIKEEKIGDISENLTEPHSNLTQRITVANRRMVRREKVRESNRIRQREKYYRDKEKENLTDTLQKPPDPSSISYSFSTATTKKKDLNTLAQNGADAPLAPGGNGNSKDPSQDKKPTTTDEDKILNREQLALFNPFWDEYPKKRNKPEAKTAFKKLFNKDRSGGPITIEQIQSIIEDVKKRKEQDPEWVKMPNGRKWEFVPYAQKYLNKKLWRDEYQAKEDPFDKI
jgi:hypothetical protein